MKKEIKIVIAVVLCIVVSVVSYKVGHTVGFNYGVEQEKIAQIKAMSNTEEETTSISTTQKETTTTKPQPTMSEWGFDNIDVWGGKLLKIYSPDIGTDANGTYVIVEDCAAIYDFKPQSGYVTVDRYCINESSRGGTGTCSLLDNDSMSVQMANSVGGAHVLLITNRKVVEEYIIFTIRDYVYSYYIPYNMIDSSKEPVFYSEGDLSYDYYKVYLK